jgi:acyl carrier protein/NADP-dependent 3-hydroxy acid dehydrogenase YdfG
LRCGRLHRDASYLLTGGTGGVGRLVAREMAARGAGHLILMSRSGLAGQEASATGATGGPLPFVSELEALGATVTLWKGDVANQADMQSLGAALRSMPPLRGVVHAAAHIDEGRVQDLTLDAALTMLRPKVTGTWLLDRLARDYALDFFVMFSSTAGVFGARNLAHYAAANVFLDVFAQARRAEGNPASTVSWGTWEVIHGSDEQQQAIDRGGLKIMPAARTLDAFLHLLDADAGHVVFADIDWATLKPLYESRRRRPLFAEVGAAASRIEAAPVLADRPDQLLADRVRQARPSEQRPMLQGYVREIAAVVLGLRVAQVEPKKGLFDLGMDSLMAVDLKTRLERSLGCTLPSTLTFNYPTVAAISAFVASEVLGLDALAAAPVPGAANTPGAADDDEMSEDELVSLLAARLGEIQS